jgi:hypothetical protein
MRDLRGTIALALCMLCGTAACGDDDPGCEIPTGAWSITYTETSGDCQIGSYDVLVVYDGTAASLEQLPDGCTGDRTLVDGQCTLVIDLTCEALDPSGAYLGDVRTVGELNFVSDDRLEGTVSQEAVGPDGSSCKSRFDVVGAPQ